MGVLTTIGCIATAALVPYMWLLSNRAPTLDKQQTLISTHQPDFLRVHEIVGAAILVALVIGIRRHRVDLSDRRAIYAASLALLPFVVFNQQVLTGKAMQSFHFEIFVVNYSTLIGLLILLAIFWNPVSKRLLMWMAALSLSFGLLVVALPSRVLFVPSAIADDKRVPVLLRLKQLSTEDGTLSDLRATGQTSALVFSPDLALSVLLPTWTSHGTLLDMGGLDFGSVTPEERKRFFYMHLYYSTAKTEDLRKALIEMAGDPTIGIYARSIIFGHERITPALSFDFKPIQPDEIEREVRAYEAFVNSFSRTEVLKRPISYAIVPVERNFDFTNLDRWYERDAGERVGNHILYKLKLRS
jgi:hypothetical protein